MQPPPPPSCTHAPQARIEALQRRLDTQERRVKGSVAAMSRASEGLRLSMGLPLAAQRVRRVVVCWGPRAGCLVLGGDGVVCVHGGERC